VPANAEAEEIMAKMPERQPLKARVSVPRISKAHDLFFAVISDALQHWPHNTDPHPLPGETEKLRAYLLCRAGWCTADNYPLSSNAKLSAMTVASVSHQMEKLRAKGEHPFLREGRIEGEPALCLYVSKSISHDVLDELEFEPIRSDVFALIEHITGIEVQHFINAYHERKAREAQQRAA
jgi:hypothetical protein